MVKKEKEKDKEKEKNEKPKNKNLLIFTLAAVFIIILIFLAVFYLKNKTDIYKENTNSQEENNTDVNVSEEVKECIEDWNCTEWGICNNTYSTRKCTDKNNCNTKKNKPEEKKDCCFWNCSEWSECLASNTSFRKCDLPIGCNITNKKPETRVNCTYESLCKDEEGEVDYNREGEIIDKNGNKWSDYCIDDKKLSEVYCGNDGRALWKEHTCENECDEGECD